MTLRDVPEARAPAAGAGAGARAPGSRARRPIAIATARPFSPSGPTSTVATTMLTPTAIKRRDDGRRRVLERVEGAGQDGDQRVRGEPDEEDRERRARSRRAPSAPTPTKPNRSWTTSCERAIPSAVIAIITKREHRQPADEQAPERVHAAGRRLARQRRQQHDAQRHADHADRDLEHGEREVEHGDRPRREASTRGWSSRGTRSGSRPSPSARGAMSTSVRRGLRVAEVDPRPDPRADPAQRRDLDEQVAGGAEDDADREPRDAEQRARGTARRR